MTETQTPTLTDFLLARIAEDEEGVEALRENGVWETECFPFSMARVLAECEAKRRIVGWHIETEGCCEERWGAFALRSGAMEAGVSSSGDLSIRQPIGFQPYIGCVTLMHLATIYADHPDYREEWRA